MHTEAIARRRFYTEKPFTQKPLQRETVTRGNFYTQTFLHAEAFAQSRFCTILFYTQSFYTEKPSHKAVFTRHNTAFTHRRFYTHRNLYTKHYLHKVQRYTKGVFAERFFRTKKKRKETFPTEQVVHKTVFTRRNLLHTGIFGTKRHLHRFVFTCVKIIVLPQLLKSNRLAKSQRRLPGINKGCRIVFFFYSFGIFFGVRASSIFPWFSSIFPWFSSMFP